MNGKDEDAMVGVPADRAAAPEARRHSRSVDMIDFGVECWRRGWIFVIVLIVCVAAASVVAMLQPARYQYSVFIGLAGLNSVTAFAPIETPQATAARIEAVDVPDALRKIIARGGLDHPVSVSVTVPSGALGINVSMTGPRASSELAGEILAAAARSATTDLNHRLDRYVAAQTQYLKNERELVESQIRALRHTSKTALAGGGTGPAEAVYLSGEVANLENRASEIRQNLEVDLAANVQYSDVVGGVRRSPWPVGLGMTSIIGIGVVAGIALGFIAIWLAGYIAAVRKRLVAERRSAAVGTR